MPTADRIPVCNMTMRVLIGMSLGDPVKTGMLRNLGYFRPDVVGRTICGRAIAEMARRRVRDELSVIVPYELRCPRVVPERCDVAGVVEDELGVVVDDCLEHRDRSGVERALGSTKLTDGALDFRDRSHRGIDALHHFEGLPK